MARSLTKQAIELQIRGLNTKTANVLRLPGELETAHNVYMDKTGELRKRNGSAVLSTTDDASSGIATGQRISGYGRGLVLDTGRGQYLRKDATRDTWGAINGSRYSYASTFTPVADGGGSQANPDCVYVNGVIVTAWESANGLYYSVSDSTNNQQLKASAVVSASGFSPRLVACGNKVMLLWYEAATGIRAATLDTALTTLTFGSATTVIATANIASKVSWDAGEFSSTQAKVVARSPSTSALMYVALISTTGVISAAASNGAINTGASTEYGVAWALNTSGDGKHYVVLSSYLSGSSQWITKTIYDSSLAHVSVSTVATPGAATPMDCTRQPAAVWDGSTFYYFAPARYDGLSSFTNMFGGSSSNYYAASSPFQVNGITYILLHNYVSGSTTTLGLTDNIQPHYLLVVVGSTSNAHGLFAVGSANPLPPNFLPSPSAGQAATEIIFPIMRRTRVGTRVTEWAGVSTVVDARNVAVVTRLDFAPTYALGNPVEAGGVLFMPGGSPSIYDGQTNSPYQGVTPDKPRHAGPTTGTYLFSYVATFEWTDALGNVHRSAPSAPAVLGSATATPSGAVSISIRTPAITSFYTKMYLVVWRTKANGTEYQRLVTTSGNTSPLIGQYSFSDAATDATLGAGEFLYTTGGVIENMAPPPCKVACAHRGRIWVASSEFPGEMWYSKENETNICAEFSGYMTTDVGHPSEGEVTAIASLDSRLIVFKANAIYHISGDGPDNTGVGEFSPAEKLPADIGTVHPRSVVTTPLGVMFQAGTSAVGGQGIYLIGRDLNVSYIGAPVKDFESLTITGAVYVPSASQVRFTSDTGTTLVYDVINSQWFDWSGQGAAVGSCLWNGTHAWLSSAGVVSYENPAQFGDNGTQILSSIKFAPISLSGLANLGRVYDVALTMRYMGAHLLQIKLYYDYGTAATDLDVVYPVSGTSIIRARPTKQKCSALQIEVYDTPTGLSDSFALSGITLTVGAKGRISIGAYGVTPT